MSILQGLQVIEIPGDGSAAWAGKHLADWGAQVTILEPASGTPLREQPPYYEKDGVRKSGTWEWLSRGKKVVRVGPGTNISFDDVLKACANADVVFIDSEMAGAVLGLSPAEVRSKFEGKTNCVLITPFATDGPYADYRATDLGINSLGGWVDATGYQGREPLRLGCDLNSRVSGLHACASALAAMRFVENGGVPQYIELSRQAAAYTSTLAHWLIKQFAGYDLPRAGNMGFPSGVMKCKDGYAAISPFGDAQWVSLLKLMGFDDILAEPGGDKASYAQKHGLELEPRAEPWFAAHLRDEVVEMGQANHIPGAPVESIAENLVSPQLVGRGYWHTTPVDDKTVKVPRVPYILNGVEPVNRGPVENATGLAVTKAPAKPKAGNPSFPLEGIRVLDSTHYWVGPYSTAMMASFGADVIKVEPAGRGDVYRYSVTFGENAKERGGLWLDTNFNKRSVTMALKETKGRELFERLAVLSDVVIDNFAPGVMDRFGLTAERLLSVNPRLLVVRMPGYGAPGPRQDWVSHGPAGEMAGGLADMVGYEGCPPIVPGNICDTTVGVQAAMAVMLGLRVREVTGKGMVIDIPQGECFQSLFAPESIAVQFGLEIKRRGNHHEWMAPHNTYRVAGKDIWISIVVATDEEFKTLVRVLGKPELASDARFATMAARKQNEAALDSEISELVKDREQVPLEKELQAKGVMACRVSNKNKITENEGFQHIGYFKEVNREVVGTYPQRTWPCRFSTVDNCRVSPPPLLGQHTVEVLTELLGMTPEQIKALADAKVI